MLDEKLRLPIQAGKRSITIDDVVFDLKAWREKKTNNFDKIPDEIWNKILLLLQNYPRARVFRACGITSSQLDKKTRECSLDEVRDNQGYSNLLVSLPHDDQSSQTVAAEFHRNDGAIMKLHVKNTELLNLLNAFFSC